jgi:polyisoprenoid-binding protein YceI
MKKMILLIVAITLATAALSAKEFKLNKKVGPPTLKFFSNAPLEDIEGHVENDNIRSTVSFDKASPEKASGKVSFDVEAMLTGLSTRDRHLQSDDWLNAAKYPKIEFMLNGIKIGKKEADGSKTTYEGKANGVFKMYGQEKSIEVPVKITYLDESSQTKDRAPGDFLLVEGEFVVNWKEFGVKGKRGMEDKVSKDIKVQLKLFYNSGN